MEIVVNVAAHRAHIHLMYEGLLEEDIHVGWDGEHSEWHRRSKVIATQTLDPGSSFWAG